MIYLKKGQPLFDNPGMVVYDQTGYYDDGTSILCAASYAPEEPLCRYEAKFIAYGEIVYKITDPEKLMEEIVKIDPQSLYGKDSKQVAVDKIVENIVPQTSENIDITKEPTTSSENEVSDTTTEESEDKIPTDEPDLNEEIPVDTNTNSTTTPVLNLEDNGQNNITPTTTPEIILPDGLKTEDLTTLKEMPTSTPTLTAPETLLNEVVGEVQKNIDSVTE